MSTVFVFKPDTLDLNSIGFLQGFSKRIENSDSSNLAFYIIRDELVTKSSSTVGYCSEVTPDNNAAIIEGSEWIHINSLMSKITLHNTSIPDESITCISYDSEKFRRCDSATFKAQNYGEHFETLYEAIQKTFMVPTSKRKLYFCAVLIYILELILKVFDKLKLLCRYSSTMAHFENSMSILKWSLISVKQERKISLKVGNVVASKILDLFLGFVVFFFILKYERQLLMYLNTIIEAIIHNLKELLDILMGSPIGLKLNHAFNTTLGIFFFYHISLWKVFVHFTRPLLYSAFYFLMFPAALGLSFQAALFEDLIKFCTIHVYCIYVYAARLYGLQIHALMSLWRVFIGRKYNPLRQRVDSYQYSHHQLFIGTLGFTILLFLLPTTLLYYVVFTVFRLGLKLLNYLLTYLRVALQHLPIYVMALWICNSPRVAGTITLKVKTERSMAPLTLYATLSLLPLWTSLKGTLPDCILPLPRIIWSNIFHNLFIGSLL